MKSGPPGKIGVAIRELHRAECSLSNDFRVVADRHHVEHEIRHVSTDLARWSDSHIEQLAEHAGQYGLRLRKPVRQPVRRMLGPAQRRLSQLARQRREPAIILLADLRRLHRKAAGVYLDWTLLGQGAHATKNHELLTLAQTVSEDTRRQVNWTTAMLEALAPQVLAS